MARPSKNSTGAAAAICLVIAFLMGIGAWISFSGPSQPMCNGQVMQPGDTCIVTESGGGASHIDTYEDRLQQVQSAPVRGTVFLLGALALAGVGIFLGVRSRRQPGAGLVGTAAITAAVRQAAGGQASSTAMNTKETWMKAGDALRTQQRFGEAVRAYDQVIQLDPTFTSAWISKGNVLLVLASHEEEALAAFERALQLDPTSPGAWTGKGAVFRKQKRYEEALAAYDRAIQLDRAFGGAWVAKGDLFQIQKRYEEALAAYEGAMQFAPTYANAWIHKGDLFKLQQRYEEALAAYEQALQLEPTNSTFWIVKGSLLRQWGKSAEADQAFARANAIKSKR